MRLFTTVAPDFRVLWLAADDLIKGLNPYVNPEIFTGVGYPVNTLLFYIPFTFLPYQIAQNVFSFISFFCLYFSVWISLRILKIEAKLFIATLILFLSLVSFPVKFTFGMGQNNILVLAMLLVSFWFFLKKRDIVSGIILGLAIGLKTIFLFFLLFYFLKKKWKLILTSLITMVLLVFTTGFIFGWDFYSFYFSDVIPPLLNLQGREIYYNQGLMGFVSRITKNLFVRKQITFLISALFVGMGTWLTRKRKNIQLQFSLFVVILTLIDTLSWQHHFVWLLYPFIVVFYFLIKEKKKTIIGLLMLSYFLVSFNFRVFPERNFISPFILSHVFWGTIMLFFLNYWFLIGRKIKKKN